MDSEPTGLNTRQALGVLRRRAQLILLCFVLVAGRHMATPSSRPRSTRRPLLLPSVTTRLTSRSLDSRRSSSSDSSLAQQASNLELVRLGDMAAKTARLLGHGLTDGKGQRELEHSRGGENRASSTSRPPRPLRRLRPRSRTPMPGSSSKSSRAPIVSTSSLRWRS